MSHKPPGLSAVTPYLTVADPEALIAFVETVLHGELAEKHEDATGAIRHAKMRVEDGWIELSGASAEWGPTPAALHVYLPDVDAAHARALAAGATELMPPTAMPYGERGSAVRDGNGNNWYLATYTG